MFLFGHLGFGLALAKPVEKTIAPIRAFGAQIEMQRAFWLLALGALLPDLFDKPIFYLSHHQAAGTRLLGHSLIFLINFILFSIWRKSRTLALISIGLATHLLIDNLGDAMVLQNSVERNCRIVFWPLLGWTFPPTPYLTFSSQLHRLASPYFMVTESIGVCLFLYFAYSVYRPRRSKADRERVEPQALHRLD
jgi:membrane-bound metal-dependent hydrolase YbcI (DUF457 family)